MPVDPSTIVLRPQEPADEAFLREVYASTREEELNAWGFSPEMRKAFLDQQFKAQRHGYLATFSEAEFFIIVLGDKSVGSMIVNRGTDRWCLVDIALLTPYRNQGIGAALVQRLSSEAAAAGRALELSVLKGNRALRFYQRLGFVKTGESGLHDLMEWRGASSQS